VNRRSCAETTPDVSTKNLTANKTYYYHITLNDGSTIEFHYGLK